MNTSRLASLTSVQIRYHGSDEWVPKAPLTLDLRKGGMTLLIGPSGCGKSTIGLTIDGLIPHSIPSVYKGSILVNGTEVADSNIAPLAQFVGLVMQDPDSQIVRRTVWDEVCYALENLCLARSEIDARAEAALRLLKIVDLAPRDPWTLSGGQRQRVVLACAIAQRPRILVLDEPTANLDPVAAHDLHVAIAALKNEGTSLLVVEHNLDDLAHLADRVIALDGDGRLLADGDPRTVFGDGARSLIGAGIRVPTSVDLGLRLGLTPPPIGPEATTRALLDLFGPTSPIEPAAPPPDEPDAAHRSGTDPSNGTPAVLEARALGVSHRGIPLLSDIDLDIRSNEMIALIGSNGSGKSTLLRTLVGLQRPSSGRVISHAERGRGRGRGRFAESRTLVTQNPEHQFVTGSVRDELGHSLRLAGRPQEEIDARVARMLDDYALAALADRNPFTLSGGQKRRLSVAAALTVPRELVLLDEPTFGQDERHVHVLMSRMRAFADSSGSVVFATHDLALAAAYARRVVLIADGRILADGPARTILADSELLASAGLRPTPLAVLVERARARGANVPTWLLPEDADLHRAAS